MIDLVMALHCHQPVGNFDHVFELAHDKCYRPVLELLADHPAIRLGMHFSGCLLEWLEKHKPEAIDLLASLVGRDQIEMLSGGFYEPLLATIPPADARGQVGLMNDWLKSRFGRIPTGFWLTERIWEPELPAVLAGTGLEYTIVDDTHFYYSGLKVEDIFGPYLTEREGHTLKILATPMIMRYMIPFRLVEVVIEQLKQWHEAGHRLAVYGDDGEKFGLWPETHEWVIKKGWLEYFFRSIEANSGWLRTTPPGEYARAAEPLGRIYMPPASYEEMTEWALPPERGEVLEDLIATLKAENRWETWRPFVRGGIWDNFLVKYDETNRLHKKMFFLSRRAGQDEETRRLVWRAQCNCAYWHGVFGGLYMGHLRRAVHENLVQAQARLVNHAGGEVKVHRLDYDRDGHEEIILESPSLSLGLAPARGGAMFDLCHLGKSLNLADVLTRRPEAYHRRLRRRIESQARDQGVASIHDIVKVKEEGLERLLVYDAYVRMSLLDHFLNREVSPPDLAANRYEEIGDFIQGRYVIERCAAEADAAEVRLARTGRVGSAGLKLTKTIRINRAPGLSANYEFERLTGSPGPVLFGCEFNLNLFSDQDGRRYLLAPEYSRRREVYETGGEYGLHRLDLINGADRLKMTFRFSRPVNVGFFPLLTVSMSEDGFEKTYQGTSLMFFLPLNPEPGRLEEWRLDLELVEI
ncbi:MAG: alpha-amylase/4-alpha-glucanotransferase domain-containing protein [Thermodesulfobacteriota bacterium]